MGPADKRPDKREKATASTQSCAMWREQEGLRWGHVCTAIVVKDGKPVSDPSGHKTTGKHLLTATCG